MLPADIAPASFRGVRFYVPKDTVEQGRNIIHHNYPDSNLRYDEDNGGHAPTFKFPAWLFGAGLPSQVKALHAALNKPGPGTLNHPYLGSWTCAAVGPYKTERSDDDAGVITLDLTFSVTTSGSIFPGVIGGVAAAVSVLAGSAVSSIASSFATSFGAGPLSAISRDAIAGQIQTIGTTMASAFASSTSPLQMIAAAGNLASDPSGLVNLLATGMRSPFELPIDVLSPERLMAGFQQTFDAGSAVAAAGFSGIPDLSALAGRIGL